MKFYSYKYIGNVLGAIIYYLIPIRKKVVLKNLKMAFPKKSEKEIRKIAKMNYVHFATLIFEILGMDSFSREEISSFLKFSDYHKFEKRIREGKAMLLLTAHFGNWELGATVFGIQFDRVVYVLAKQQSNSKINDWINRNRETFGNKVIPLGSSVRDLYKAVKLGGIVGVVGDQRGPKENPRVDFMGIPTAVYTGTAAIALKTNTPIIVVICIKQPDSTYIGTVEEIDLNEFSGSDEEKVVAISQKYMDILTKYVREYPEQWFWMHNIWKY